MRPRSPSPHACILPLLLVLLPLLLPTHAHAGPFSEMDLWEQGSRRGEIDADGDIWVAGRRVGEIDAGGDVWRGGSRVGDVEPDGNIWWRGSRVGRIDADGDLWLHGSRVGSIDADGDIWIRGSRWGQAEGCRGSHADRRAVAAYVLFFRSVLPLER